MLFEDAQWSDPTSIELLDLIVDRATSLRLLLIVTLRPEFVAPWTGRPHVSLLSLNRLPRRERAAIIAVVTGGKALPDGADHRPHRRSATVRRGTDQGGDRERPADRPPVTPRPVLTSKTGKRA